MLSTFLLKIFNYTHLSCWLAANLSCTGHCIFVYADSVLICFGAPRMTLSSLCCQGQMGELMYRLQ